MKEKVMDEELLKVIEEEGWSVCPSIQDGKHIVEISVFSPAGEDFFTTIWCGDGSTQEFVEELGKYIDGYDVDEETYLCLGTDGHGKNGAPYHIEDILEDKEWCLSKMETLYEKLKNRFINN